MTPNDRASSALENFANTDAEGAADAAARAFELAGERIERALIKAAKTGELSFKDMAESILRDLAKLAVQELITSPLETVLGGLGQTSGGGGKSSGSPLNITFNMSGVSDAQSFGKSQGQISAALARAVSDGQKFF